MFPCVFLNHPFLLFQRWFLCGFFRGVSVQACQKRIGAAHLQYRLRQSHLNM